MNLQSLRESALFVISLGAIALVVSGPNACQEDYVFGTQSSIGTVTPTVTPEETDDGEFDDDDDLVEATPTEVADATPTPADVEPATPTPTAAATPTELPTAAAANAMLGVLQDLSATPQAVSEDDKGGDGVSGGTTADVERPQPQNWLGKNFSDDSQSITERTPMTDSDGDGFTDHLESDASSDPFDADITPPTPASKLRERMAGVDDDMDGLTNRDEDAYGTDPSFEDSDEDGYSDGVEVWSGSDPLAKDSVPQDQDGDGIADSYEAARGASPQQIDTDSDGLRDDMEFIVGSNVLIPDTDGDGILDGKEVELGSDPLVRD